MTPIPRPDRRTVLLSAAGLLAPACSRGRGQTPDPARSPMRCSDFLSSVGVNTHLSYSDSQYNDLSTVVAALRFVGIRFVRDAAIDRTKPNAQHYGALAAAGISFCLYWGPRRSMGDAIDQIGALANRYPGAVCGLEGPNEIKPAFAYAGLSGNDAAKTFMADLRRAADLSAPLRKAPLVSFTSYAPASSDCDFANAHPYPKKGRQPGEVIEAVRQRFVGPAGVMPGRAMMFTELGYHTLVGEPTKQGQWQGVNPETQACLILNALFDGAILGISRTYLYQLLDGQGDPQDSNPQHHFGLFNFDGSPKPSATALKALFTILRDGGSRPRTAANRPFDGQIDASPSIRCLPLSHPSGRQFLALWNETPIWDSAAAAPLHVSPTTVRVSLPGALRVVGFDVVDGGRKMEFSAPRHIEVPIGAGPVILSID